MLNLSPISSRLIPNGIEYIYPCADFDYSSPAEINVLNASGLVNLDPDGVKLTIPNFFDANNSRMCTNISTDLILNILGIDVNLEGYRLPVKELAWGDIYSPGTAYDILLDSQYKGLSFTKLLNTCGVLGSVSEIIFNRGLSVRFTADYTPFITNAVFVPDLNNDPWQVNGKLFTRIQQVIV